MIKVKNVRENSMTDQDRINSVKALAAEWRRMALNNTKSPQDIVKSQWVQQNGESYSDTYLAGQMPNWSSAPRLMSTYEHVVNLDNYLRHFGLRGSITDFEFLKKHEVPSHDLPKGLVKNNIHYIRRNKR